MAQDKVLTCVDCKADFFFTFGEAAFYQSKGFTEPKRCPNCRQIKKEQRESRAERHSNRSDR